MRDILIISRSTIKELVRGQVFLIAFFMGLALAILTYVGVELSYGAPTKVAIDFGMGLISICNIAISVFLGVRLLKNEIENRTLYIILSRPISRTSFYFGKISGLALTLLAMNVVIGIQTLWTYWYYGGKFDSLIPWALVFNYFEGLIILGFVVLFSLITTNIASVLFGLGMYVIGHMLPNLIELPNVQRIEILHSAMKYALFFVPDLNRINIKSHLLYGSPIDFQYLMMALAYCLAYLSVIFFLSVRIFKSKDLN